MADQPSPVVPTGQTQPPFVPRIVILLVGFAAAFGTMLGAQQLAWLIGPVFLALVIVILIYPVHTWMLKHRIPRAPSLILLLVAVYGVIVALVAIVLLSVTRLAGLLPEYTAASSVLLQTVTEQLVRLGLDPSQVRSVLSDLDLRRAAGWLTSALGQLVSFGANVAFLLSLLLFIGIESTGMGSRMAALTRFRPGLESTLVTFARNTRRFLAVTTVFGLITGLADTILLWWLDIPLAILWGLLAAISNYIPYVGFVIGLVPPALLALLGHGWQTMLVVIVAYIVLNSLFTTLIQPYFVGDAVGLSMTLTLIALVFWGWVLGPLGAILAIPLTLLVKGVLVDADPRTAWANSLLGPVPAAESGEAPDEHDVHPPSGLRRALRSLSPRKS